VTDAEFLSAFEASAIRAARWRHIDHVRMAFLFLRDHPFPEALGRIRSGILAPNRANGVVESDAPGSHETATVARAHMIASCMTYHGSGQDQTSFADFAEANPHLCATTLLRVYYTRQRILSPAARAVFVEPDLAPLPRLT